MASLPGAGCHPPSSRPAWRFLSPQTALRQWRLQERVFGQSKLLPSSSLTATLAGLLGLSAALTREHAKQLRRRTLVAAESDAGSSQRRRRRRRRKQEEDLGDNFTLAPPEERSVLKCDCALILDTIIEADFLTQEECDIIISAAEKRCKEIPWGSSAHENYPTEDIKVWELKKNKAAMQAFREKIVEPMKILIAQEFDLPEQFVSVDDAFVVRYMMGESKQQRLNFHRDGSIVSAIVTLSPSSDYRGGGTLFQDGTLIRPEQGGGIIFGGQRLHGGDEITAGKRYILTLFFKVGELSCREEALAMEERQLSTAFGEEPEEEDDIGFFGLGR